MSIIPDIKDIEAQIISREGKSTMKFRCLVCGKPTLNRCSGCHEAFYCCKEHQKKHWPAHRATCLNSRIARGKGLALKNGKITFFKKFFINPKLVENQIID